MSSLEILLYGIIGVMILLHIRSFYLLQQFNKTKNEIERSNEKLEEQLREFVQAVEVKNRELVAEVEGYLADAQASVPQQEKVSVDSVEGTDTPPFQKKPAPKKKPASTKPTHVAATYQQYAAGGESASDELDQIRLYDRQGKSVSEMATLLGRAESEINLLLFMARKESNG